MNEDILKYFFFVFINVFESLISFFGIIENNNCIVVIFLCFFWLLKKVEKNLVLRILIK